MAQTTRHEISCCHDPLWCHWPRIRIRPLLLLLSSAYNLYPVVLRINSNAAPVSHGSRYLRLRLPVTRFLTVMLCYELDANTILLFWVREAWERAA